MKSLIGAVMVGIVLFAASAGVSWFLVNQSAESQTDEITAVDETDPASAFPEPIKDGEKVDAMPVAIRPDTPVTVEAVTKLAQSIMKKEQSLFDSQQQLHKEERRINLLFVDLKRERDELMAFGERIDAKILQAREATELLKQQSQALNDQTKVLSTLEKKTGKTSTDAAEDQVDRRVQTVKKWFKSQEPEQAAKYLKEFVNNGDLEFAARLLDTFSDRQIPKILTALNDVPLATQLADALLDDDEEDSSTETATRPNSTQSR
jgi:hypothetical protein